MRKTLVYLEQQQDLVMNGTQKQNELCFALSVSDSVPSVQ